MNDKINTAELEGLIRQKIKEKGLSNDIGEDKISEITKNISSLLMKPELSEAAPVEEQPTPTVSSTPTPVLEKPVNSPESISKTTTISKDAIDLAKREGELEQREKEFVQKQSELTVKERELKEKEQALEYKPQIPEILQGIGNEKFFVFNENELSLGAEALSTTPFRLMSNPDDKRSMIELWATQGKQGADMFLVHFERIGEVIFNPFEGTANYAKKPIEDGQNHPNVPNDGLTPAEAQASQEPTEQMSDTVEPKTDVTLPASIDMGLNVAELEKIVKDRVDSIVKNYFSQYPKV